MKKTNKHQVYEAPKAEIIEIESQGVLCTSGGGAAFGAGAGANGMNNGGTYGW